MKCLFWVFLIAMLASMGIAVVWVLRGNGNKDDDGGDY
jgi:hypothetical protein